MLYRHFQHALQIAEMTNIGHITDNVDGLERKEATDDAIFAFCAECSNLNYQAFKMHRLQGNLSYTRKAANVSMVVTGISSATALRSPTTAHLPVREQTGRTAIKENAKSVRKIKKNGIKHYSG